MKKRCSILFNLKEKYRDKIDRDLFLLLLRFYSSVPLFDGAYIYTFNGVYAYTGQATVRRIQETLIMNLQEAGDNNHFLEFFTQTDQDSEYNYRMASENCNFLLRKENVFTKAVYPEFYSENALKNIEMLKMMVLV